MQARVGRFTRAPEHAMIKRPSLPLRLPLLAILACFLAACGGAQVGSPSQSASSSFSLPSIFPDETVDEPYLPIDDGVPLSAKELAAFNSTGELDATLTAAQKREVELHFKFYVHTHRRTMERYLERSEAYLPYIRHILKSRGMPEEIASLAFVESGFNPNAVSRAGAGGMWQFMPFTGKKYGLLQDRWMDERRDPFKATEAAAEYLTVLHEMFGDWLLALAAYNAGEGKIQRALSGTEAGGFFEICERNEMLEGKAKLKPETMQYVPRLLAFTKIMRNLDDLGFVTPDPKKALSIAQVTVPAGVDLTAFAKGAGISWNDFTVLNPAYRRLISPPDRGSRAYVPLDRETQAVAWLERKEASLYAGWKDYKVRKGDTLGAISQKYGVSVALLRQVNGKKSNALKVGEWLLVPGSTRAARATLDKLPPELAAKAGTVETSYAKGAAHTIAKGDTLFALALAWGTTLDAVCEANDLEPKSTLRIGQVVYRPVPKPKGVSQTLAEAGSDAVRSFSVVGTAQAAGPAAAPAAVAAAPARSGAPASGGGCIVTVRSGDTLYGIARAHGVSVADLQTWNKLGSSKLSIGQKLRVSPGGVSVADAGGGTMSDAGGGKTVTIKSGDTLFAIAQANRTTVAALAKANNLSPNGTLRPGQTLRLP